MTCWSDYVAIWFVRNKMKTRFLSSFLWLKSRRVRWSGFCWNHSSSNLTTHSSRYCLHSLLRTGFWSTTVVHLELNRSPPHTQNNHLVWWQAGAPAIIIIIIFIGLVITIHYLWRECVSDDEVSKYVLLELHRIQWVQRNCMSFSPS